MKPSRWLALSLVVLALLAAPQCRKEKAPEPKPKGTPAVPAPEDAAKTSREQAAKASVFDINTLLEDHKAGEALSLATASLQQYADTAAAPEILRLKTKAEEAVRAAEPAKAPPAPAPPAPRRETPASPGHQRFLALRDAGIAAMNEGNYAGAIASFQSALKEEPDASVQALLQKSQEMSGPPRLAVAEFEVGDDVGITDAGRIVADALLREFDPQRFRQVDRGSFAALLAAKGLEMARVAADPLILRDQEVREVRYLVLGRISRIGALMVSARLVDLGTGDVVQTGEVFADDENGLLRTLPELAATLQMTDEEKTQYSGLGETDAARLTEERRAAETSFQERQHARDALSAVTEIRMFLARGDLDRARQYAAWASRQFADTPALAEIDDLRVVIEREIGARREDELRRIHERFLRLRERGRAEAIDGNIDAAILTYEEALRLEDDPAVRQQLQWLRLPGLAVPDFDVSGDVGLANPARTLAGYVLDRMAGDGRKYRAVERQHLDKELRRLGLTQRDAARTPADLYLRRMPGIRYLVCGQARPGSVVLTAGFYDLADRRVVQTAEVTVRRTRDIQRGLDDLVKMLQMPNEKRRIYADQLRARTQMEIGDEAAAAKKWQEASAAYDAAYKISGDRKALEKKANADRTLGAQDAYAKAMAKGRAAQAAGSWAEALAAYETAAGADRTPASTAEVEAARRSLYADVMAAGRAAEQAADWVRALGAYETALKVTNSIEARNAIVRVKAKLEPVKPEPPKPEPVVNPEKPVEPKEPKQPTPYEQALAKGNAARDAGNWAEALAAYEQAAKLDRTPAAVTEVGKARRSLYDAVMASGRAAEQASDWPRALAAYEMAVKVSSSAEARNAVARMKAKLEPPKIGPAKPEPVPGPEKPAEQPKPPAAPGAYEKALADGDAALAEGNTAWAKRDAALAAGDAAGAAKAWDMAAAEWARAQAAFAQARAAAPDATARTEVGKRQRAVYNATMAQGNAAEKAGEWAKAAGAYETAFKALPSAEARAALERVKKKLAPSK
jgi:tetratricopeptide (TPR) repeat protein